MHVGDDEFFFFVTVSPFEPCEKMLAQVPKLFALPHFIILLFARKLDQARLKKDRNVLFGKAIEAFDDLDGDGFGEFVERRCQQEPDKRRPECDEQP